MTYFPKKGVWKKDNQWDVILFWFSAVFHCTRNSTSLAKSPNHLVQDHQFTVSFLPFVRCVLHSCSAYDTCLDKLGIQCNFHDLGGQSRFFEWLGWSVKGHTVEWRQTLTLVFVPSPSSMRKCKVFYGKCQTQCLAHMQKAVISKWALDRGEPPPHTHTHWDTHSVIMPIVFLSCCTERKNLHLSHAVLLTSYLIFFLAYSLSDPVWPYIHKHL